MNYMTKRILVVDDDPLSLHRTARTLIQAGFETVLASSGDAAMRHLAADSFDAVVSDVIMPRMNGFELLENVLIRFPGLPVILMTATRREEMQEAALVCGATDLLEKPVDAAKLIAAVQSGFRGEFSKEPTSLGDAESELEERSVCLVAR
jgi:DNA-binding NtrC family response regulator